MNFKVEIIPPERWREISPHCHKISFGRQYPTDFERVDFALFAVGEDNTPLGFITVMELNKNHIYWQYGGAFPGTEGTMMSYKLYQAGRDICAQKYKSVSTLIENENIVMLKFALKLGFKIVGVKHIFHVTYVEMFLNLGE